MPNVNNGVLDGVRRIAGRFRDLTVDGTLPGAPLGFRARGATVSGPPVTGTWKAGDEVRDRQGRLWTCTAGGTPGRWSGSTVAVAPPGDVTGSKDAAAILAAVAALGPSGGTVLLGPGNWYLAPGAVVVEPGNSQAVVIDGQWGAVINAVGGTAGDVLRVYNPSTQAGNYNGNSFSVRSGVRGLTIDGTSAAAGSTGLHLGDIMNPQADVIIQNFSGTGSIGLHLDNSVTWTEEADIRASLVNNTSNVVFDVSGTGTVSFGYGTYDFSLETDPGQDGVVVRNGAKVYSSHLRIRGGIGSSPSFASNAVLRVTGTAPSGTSTPGAVSQVWASVLDVDVECNADVSTTGTAGPYTVYIDSASGCYVSQSTGQLNFLSNNGTFHAANATNAGNWQFFGQVLGDSVLATSVVGWPVAVEGAFSIGNWGTTQTLTTGATISLSGTGNVIPLTSASAVTGVSINWGSFDGQFVALYNSGSYPIRFAASGTGYVADGAGDVIPPGTLRLYIWSGNEDLWFPVGSPAYTGTNSLPQVSTPAGLVSYVQQSQAAATSAVGPVTAATITSLGSLSVPANDPVAGARYRVTAHGRFGTASTAPTATVDLRWGGTTGTLITSLTTGSNGAGLTASISAGAVVIEGEIEFITSTTCVGWVRLTWSGSTTSGVALGSVTTAVTVTTSSAESLSLDWTWSGAGTGTTVTIASSSFERVA